MTTTAVKKSDIKTVVEAVSRLERGDWISTPQKRRVSINGGVGARSKASVSFQHDRDPKEVLRERVGLVPEGTVQLSKILVAVYQPPFAEKTSGGILLTQMASDQDLEEYLWQGKVGLIVAMGPQAYVDDDLTKFHGTKNNIGDWVWFRPSDGMACEVNGVFCRVFTEAGIIGKIPHPDSIW